MSKARTLNPHDMEGRINKLEENAGGSEYTLPTASAETKGGVKIGSGLTMTEDVLSADPQLPEYSATEEGKVLGVDDQGALEWQTPSGGATQKAYGTGVSILSYTQADPYTVPSDGVVRIQCNYSTSSYVSMFSGATLVASCGGLSGNSNGAATVPVLKGEQLGFLSGGTDPSATFLPYVDAT